MPKIDHAANVIALFDDPPENVPAVDASSPVPYTGSYRIRGRWLSPRYARLRNAAWAVRNGRVASHQNPLALKLMLSEAERLQGEGEQLWDILEAFAELLLKP